MTGSSFFSRASWARLRPNWSRTSEPVGAASVEAPEVGAELHENLGGDSLAFPDEAEEDVLGADVVVTELERLTKGQLEDLLRPRREGDVAGRAGATLPDDLLHLSPYGLERDAQRLERLGRHTFPLVDQPEEDVLRADVVVVEQA